MTLANKRWTRQPYSKYMQIKVQNILKKNLWKVQ